ncbi:response regulator transcription factor [Limnobacter sp.]|uniref:helix-turn-helix transcriptional regulator n=1 Tax=Limnobacter sp. TaxID=2003368 RepID=UPI00351953C7
MKKIVIIERVPLFSIVMKELAQTVYPNSDVSVSGDVAQVEATLRFDADAVIADLHGELAEQQALMSEVEDAFPRARKIFFLDHLSPEMQQTADEQGSLLICRSHSYRDVLTSLSEFEKSATAGLDRNLTRNEYQSDIQLPGVDKPLTLKQAMVMDLVIQGLSGKQIARQLNLSPETVRAHLRQAYERLRANSRSQAVANYLMAKRMANNLVEM